MRIVTVDDWLMIGPALYGKIDGGFSRIIALNEPMPLVQGSRVQYSNSLTLVLGKPLGRV